MWTRKACFGIQWQATTRSLLIRSEAWKKHRPMPPLARERAFLLQTNLRTCKACLRTYHLERHDFLLPYPVKNLGEESPNAW